VSEITSLRPSDFSPQAHYLEFFLVGKILSSNISSEKEELAESYYRVFNALFQYDTQIVENLN